MSMRQGLYGLNEPALPPKPKTRLRKFLNVLFIFCSVIFVSLFTLHMVGGSTPHLKTTVEKFLSETSGYQTKIGTLNALSFYPLVGIDMEDVTMADAGRGVVAKFTHINFSTSFWSASSGSSFRSVDIRDAVMEPGVFAPGKIEVAHFFIDAADKDKPKLLFKGTYDNKPVSIVTDLSIVPGLLGTIYFNIANPSPFEIKAGDIQATGNILTDFTGRTIDIAKLSAGPNTKPVKMDIAFMDEGVSTTTKGKIQASAGDVDYRFSFSRPDKKKRITGSLKAEKFEIDDLIKSGGLLDSQKIIKNFYRAGTKSAAADFSYLNFDVAIETAHLMKNGLDLGAVEAKLVTKGDALQFDLIKASPEAGAQLNALLPALKDAALQ